MGRRGSGGVGLPSVAGFRMEDVSSSITDNRRDVGSVIECGSCSISLPARDRGPPAINTSSVAWEFERLLGAWRGIGGGIAAAVPPPLPPLRKQSMYVLGWGRITGVTSSSPEINEVTSAPCVPAARSGRGPVEVGTDMAETEPVPDNECNEGDVNAAS